jgi:hypothetical protein
MHLQNAPWILILVAAGAVGAALFLWLRRPRAIDLGAVSDRWIAEHLTNGGHQS